MPRTKPASERRADLLDGARSVFVAKGVAAATLEDITSAAGVSKGLFWQYFRSKDDLVAALQQEYAEQFARAVRAAAARAPDWPGRLDACVQACFDQFQAETDLHDVLFRHPARPTAGSGHEPAHNVLVEAIRALLADGAAAGAFDIADPEPVAYLLYAALHAFDPTFRGSNRTPDDQLVSAAQQLFRRAVGVTSPEGAATGQRVLPVYAAGDVATLIIAATRSGGPAMPARKRKRPGAQNPRSLWVRSSRLAVTWVRGARLGCWPQVKRASATRCRCGKV